MKWLYMIVSKTIVLGRVGSSPTFATYNTLWNPYRYLDNLSGGLYNRSHNVILATTKVSW